MFQISIDIRVHICATQIGLRNIHKIITKKKNSNKLNLNTNTGIIKSAVD